MQLPGNPAPLREVTDAERAQFATDGVACLRGIYPSEWLDYLRTQLDEIFFDENVRPDTPDVFEGVSARGARSNMVEVLQAASAARPNVPLAVEGGDAAQAALEAGRRRAAWAAGAVGVAVGLTT